VPSGTLVPPGQPSCDGGHGGGTPPPPRNIAGLVSVVDWLTPLVSRRQPIDGHGTGPLPPNNIDGRVSGVNADILVVTTEQMLNAANVAMAMRNFITVLLVFCK